jgi:hypothetical protein
VLGTAIIDRTGHVRQVKELQEELEDVNSELSQTYSLLFDAKTELNAGKQVLVGPRVRPLRVRSNLVSHCCLAV